MGLKLEGEYQVVDDGVKIEGRIKGSKIHDLNKLFKPFGYITLNYGQSKDGISEKYNVPHPKFRQYMINERLLKLEDEREFIRDSINLNAGNIYYRDGGTFYPWMGVQYSHGSGRLIIDQVQVMNFVTYSRLKRIVTNSAWVWMVNSDGSFDVKLRGLANRHMMTMVIGNAAKMANHLQLLAEKALDKPKLFEREYMSARI